MQTLWRVSLFGPLRVADADGTDVHLAPLQAQVIAWLAWHLGQPSNRETLLELLWPEAKPKAGRNRLSVLLSHLRGVLEPAGVPHGSVLQTSRDWISLSARTVATDLADFRHACSRSAGGTKAAHLERAVELYCTPLLDGVYAGWILSEQELLADSFLEVARRLFNLYLTRGEQADALRVARRAVVCEPLREEAHALVIRAALAGGDAASARRQFAELEQRLSDELQLRPSESLRQLVSAADALNRVSPDPQPRVAARSAASSDAVVWLAVSGSELPSSWRRQTRPESAEAWAEAGEVTWLVWPGLRRCLQFLSEVGPAEQACGLAVAGVDSGQMQTSRQRAAALARGAHPGQVLVGEVLATWLRRDAGSDADAGFLGEYLLLPGRAPERVYQLSLKGQHKRSFPRPLLDTATGGYVPLVLTRFFGRQQELAELGRDLQAHRVVAVTGPGGSGKTRLAIEFARGVQAEGQVVWFVELETAHEPQHVLERVLQALGEPVAAEPFERLTWLLRERKALVVLDNFEQLRPAAEVLLLELLERVPEQRLLLTSRRSLEMPGAAELRLPPMAPPEPGVSSQDLGQADCVALLVDRARAVRPSFRLTDDNIGDIVALCVQLDGLPLALELAAPRLQLMGPAALRRSLSDRLTWSATRRARLPDRQHTLAATVAWSHDLLPPELQTFLDGLVVFEKPFSTVDAAAVLVEPLAPDYLRQLEQASLLELVEDPVEPRCRLLGTIRQYLNTLLNEDRREQLRTSHAAYFGGLAANAAAKPDLAPLLALNEQLDDFNAALDWFAEHDSASGLLMWLNLEPLWTWCGPTVEARRRLLALIVRTPDAPVALRARAMLAAGILGASIVPLGETVSYFSAVIPTIREAEEPELLWRALWHRALAIGSTAPLRLASCAEELRELADHTGSPLARAAALSLEALRRLLADERGSWEPLVEALALLASLSHTELYLWHLVQLGVCYMMEGDLELAESALAELPELEEFAGWVPVRARWAVAYLRLLQGRVAESAAVTWSVAPHLTGSMAAHASTSSSLYVLLAATGGLAEEAVALHAGFERLRRRRGERALPFHERIEDQALALAAAPLLPGQRARSEHLGQRMPLADLAELVGSVATRLRSS